MSRINSFIEGYMTGNAWEDLCVQCYRIRYQEDNYTAIPATQDGDAGIEGFTNKGIVHQCYCPERAYSDNELYEHQRVKLTTDIEKLKKNSARLRALGVPPIIEWQFNIPEYKDSRILIHAERKRQEVLTAKKDKPSDYAHIAENFQVVIKTADDFKPEISQIIRTNITDMKINAVIKHTNVPDWSKCDSEYEVNADEVEKGGTGYCIKVENGKEIFDGLKNKSLPNEIEHIYPDYSLFPKYKFATGFLTRGCPRNCDFCVVAKKEGRCSIQVAELSEFWRDQSEIKLLDPNLLACKTHEKLLGELIQSKTQVDFTQGIDIRLTNPDNIALLNKVKVKRLHFAWDNPRDDLTKYFEQFQKYTTVKSDRKKGVYVLTNFNSTIEEDLYRIYTLRDLGFDPYVMIYEKETANSEIRHLQRWCNNKFIFRRCADFKNYRTYISGNIHDNPELLEE